MLTALAAHAQRPNRRPTSSGSDVNGYGTDRQLREWASWSFDVGLRTITVITGPDDVEQRCSSHKLGSETITRCEP
jgi:hypothetical protein